jgi:hypothetical protein
MFPTGSREDVAYLLGVLSSIPLDWQARRTVEINLTYHILNGLSFPRPQKGNLLRTRVVEVVVRLTCVDSRFLAWANFFKADIQTVEADEKEELVAELDALVCLLYGLSESQVEYIFNNFHRGADFTSRLKRVILHMKNWEKQSD